MPRDATVKDVIYALQFGRSRLVRQKTGARPTWTIEPDGIKVSNSVAEDARSIPGIVMSPFIRADEAVYVWDGAA